MEIRVTKSTELRFRALPGRNSADPFDGAKDANLSVRVVQISPDPERAPHVHPHSAEAVFVAKGRGTLWVEGERFPIEAGDTFLVPAGARHATLPYADSEIELICFFPHPDLSQNIIELVDPLN